MSKNQKINNHKSSDSNMDDDLPSQIEEENYDNIEYKLNIPESDSEEEAESQDLILVDSAKIESLNKALDAKSLKAVKTVLKIFSICFNEKELKSSKVNYQIHNGKIMNDVLDMYYTKIPDLLNESSFKNDIELLRLIYLKNCLNFLITLENEALIIRTLKGFKSFYPMFIDHKSLNKKLIREVIDIWSRDNNLSVKFNSFILIKTMLTVNDNEFKDYIYKNMFDKLVHYAPHWNWYNFDTMVFVRNCMIEAVSLSKEVAYVIIYERLKNLSALYLDVCKDKVN